ncbi:MAG: DUF2796 domain-containing protein [Hyphomicrobiaceae bacterium]
MRISAVCCLVSVGIALAGSLARPVAADSPRRQLGAHEHGKATLAIAIEGARVELALESPADDIVGFEHAPATDAEKAAVAKARKQLGEGGQLFRLTPAAGCKLQSADVTPTGAMTAKKPGGKDAHGHGKDAHSHGGEAHAEFHAGYVFMCGKPENLKGLSFPFFKAYPHLRALHVTVIGPKGQTAFEVTPATPDLTLAGVI